MELGILFKKNYSDFAKKALVAFASGKSENVVLSPFSMVMLLAILADATKGEARKEILNVIARGIYKDLTGTLADIQNFLTDAKTFMSSNALCVKKSLENSIVPEFLEKLAKYGGELFAAENCVKEVNDWVNEKTKGMIEKIVAEPMGPRFMAILMNAVAFEAKWCTPYQKSNIKKEIFTNADGCKSTVYMLKSTENNYIEDDFFTGFVKPYEGKKYSFMALLPKNESMKFFDKSLQNTNFITLLRSVERCDVNVSMPEFKYSCENGLIDFCKELGMKTVFSRDADFSPFSVLPIEISEMIQKAFIEVNRKGTKAAAATFVIMSIGASPVQREIKVVKLDRPFVYAIVHNDTGLPIFVGTVKHIEKISSEKRKNKETIWDYEPTEEEIKMLCDELDLTEKTILTESRENDDCRLACLCNLFGKRKKYRERDRIIEEFCDKPRIPFDTAY